MRQLVELHGGTIFAESEGEGRGATFTVQLPVQAAVPQALSTSDLAIRANLLQGLQILVVDDEADSRELVQFVLEQEGAIVLSVSSAIEALQVLHQAQVDILISDIGMAEMDGYMLLEQIRGAGIDFPAIALTAYAGELNQRRALSAGFAQHLSKPLDPKALVTAISTLVQ